MDLTKIVDAFKSCSAANNELIFRQLVNSARSTKYLLNSGKNVMELPLYYALGKSFLDNFDNFSSQYLKLLKDNNVNNDIFEFV